MKKTFEQGTGPYLVYFEQPAQVLHDGTYDVSHKIHRPTQKAARSEALGQAKLKNVYVSIFKNNVLVDRVRPPNRASWLSDDLNVSIPGYQKNPGRRISGYRRNTEGSVEPGEVVEFVSVAQPASAREIAQAFQVDQLELTSLLSELEDERYLKKQSGTYRIGTAAHAHVANPGSHYVWILDPRTKEPLAGEGPYGPYPRKAAETFARMGAERGTHPRAVSEGVQPDAQGFKILKFYAGGAR